VNCAAREEHPDDSVVGEKVVVELVDFDACSATGSERRPRGIERQCSCSRLDEMIGAFPPYARFMLVLVEDRRRDVVCRKARPISKLTKAGENAMLSVPECLG